MSNDLPAREGYLSFAGYRTWYRVTGESEEPGKFPLLCLHDSTMQEFQWKATRCICAPIAKVISA